MGDWSGKRTHERLILGVASGWRGRAWELGFGCGVGGGDGNLL